LCSDIERQNERIEALRAENQLLLDRVSRFERDEEEQRERLDGASGRDTEPATKSQSNVTWLSGKELVDALQRESSLRGGNGAKIWELFSLRIDSAMRWIRH